MSKLHLILVVLVLCAVTATGAGAWDLYLATATDGNIVRFSSTGASLGTFASVEPGGFTTTFGFVNDGSFYAVQYGTSLRKYTSSGTLTGVYGSGLNMAIGSTTDSTGNIYVAHRDPGSGGNPANDNGMISKFNSAGVQSTLVAAGDHGLYETYCVQYGPDGRLYVSGKDASNPSQGNDPSIYVYNTDGTFVGKRAFGPTSARDIAFKDGYVYWADFWGGTISRIAVNEFFTGDYEYNFISGYSNANFAIQGIGFGPDGNLYVSSFFEAKVLQYNGATGEYVKDFATGVGPYASFIGFTPVPEPSSLLALGGGLMGLTTLIRRGRKTK